MEHLEHPDNKVWEDRKEWFENELESAQHPLASYLVSDHATALLVDLQCCFCSGAWIAIIILSISIIDAQLRETEACDNKIGTAELLSKYFSGSNIDWLRKLRNRYVHLNIESPLLIMDDQYYKRNKMEEDARKAVKMVLHSFFQSPGT